MARLAHCPSLQRPPLAPPLAALILAAVHNPQAVIDLKQRVQEAGRAAPQFAAATQEQLQAVDTLGAQIRDAYDAIQAAYHAPLVGAPAPPPAANGRSGGRGGGATANGGNARAPGSRPPSAAPAPVVAAAPVPAVAAATPSPVADAAAAPAPVARAPAAPARQWGRPVAAPVAADGDSAEPTPAEAFRPAAVASSSSADGFKDVPAKKNRQKA